MNFTPLTMAQIFALVPHNIPVLGVAPVRAFYQFVSESDPVLRAHFKQVFFSLMSTSFMITSPDLKIFDRARWLPYGSFS
ncbi:hypothetical protein HY496_00155 [Candidatus Woesearchaeota archaeon]|nr:hypothetical protein [Candidatus Woesearchaeota archaeon]